MNNRMNDDYAIDLAQYYGVSFSGSDKSSASTNYHPNLPSLEQIASYNLQNARAEAERQNSMNNQAHQGINSSSMEGLGTSSQMLTALILPMLRATARLKFYRATQHTIQVYVRAERQGLNLQSLL